MTLHTLRLPFFAALITLCVLALASTRGNAFFTQSDGLLTVAFLDVGQGDATFIESPTGTQVLIDGGKGSAVMGPLGKAMGFFDRTIDMVVITHPDLDHTEGLISVLETYTVDTVLMTENTSDTPAYQTLLDRVQNEGAQITTARRGQIFDLGVGDAGSTTLTVLFPDHDPSNLESNTASIVTRLTYGASEYLFTGDSPQEIEEYLVQIGSTMLQSDILKVGHHGSRTSSAETFVTAVAPTYAIVSAGKDNSYGHPHKEVTDRLITHGITQKNTATLGSIFSYSDGVSTWFK